uniref:Uncharacterized protein n=1 Tax=Arion vulgaris TaxID=1028688 RepID=A0A0B7BSY8_9EUPU
MSQIMLIAGFEDGTDINEIERYIKAALPDHNEIWMDPCREPRAVVLFDKEFELKDIQKQVSGANKSKYIEAAKLTQSVFVKTYNCIGFGVKDKLKYLFASRRNGGSTVSKVEHINTKDGDCYEICFLDWDGVFKACKQAWKVEEKTLKVTPYFECFKEPMNQQLQRLIESNNTTEQAETVNKSCKKLVTSSSTVGKLNNEPLKLLIPQPSNASAAAKTNAQEGTNSTKMVAQIQPEVQYSIPSFDQLPSLTSDLLVHDLRSPKNTEKYISSITRSNPQQKSAADVKCARPVLEHPYILMLLHLLSFETALQRQYNRITVTIDETTWEIEIEGPVSFMKIVQKLLTEEDELDQPAVIESFLITDAVQQDLKAFIDSEGLHVEIIDDHGKPHFQVKDGKERRESLHDFISSLTIITECLPLPNEQSQEHTKWRKFLKKFRKTYSHQHINVQEDKSVILVSLAHMSQDIDIILSIINNTISQLEDFSLRSDSGTSFTESPINSGEITHNSASNNSDQNSRDTSELQTKAGSKLSKKILCPQNRVLLWILNVLNLKDAVKQHTSNLEVNIDKSEEEIIIKGTREAVHNLNSVLMAEDEQLPFSEQEQRFLTDTVIQQYLESCLTELGYCIVLNNNLDISVAKKDEQGVELRTFLTSFIVFRKCRHLPEKYQMAKEWKSLLEYFKSEHPSFRILTAHDNVYLLHTALEEKLFDVALFLNKVNETISTLTSTVTQSQNEIVDVCTSTDGNDPKFEDEVKLQSCQIVDGQRKLRNKQVKIHWKHSVLLWILKNLHLNQAVKDIGVDLTIDTADEISMKGPNNIVQTIKTSLLTEDNEMPFRSHEVKLLSDVQIQEFVVSCFNHSVAHIVLGDNLDLYVEIKSGEKKLLRDFITSSIQFRKCLDIPKLHQDTKEWRKLVEESRHYHHVHVTGEEVYLLSLALNEGSYNAATFVKEINTTISILSSPTLDYSRKMEDSNQVMLVCTEMKKKYFLKFQGGEIGQIQSRYEREFQCPCIIENVQNGFTIHSTSPEMNKKVTEELQSIIDKIISVDKSLIFPGLQAYLNTVEPNIIETLSDNHKCLIEIQDKVSSQSRKLSGRDDMLSVNSVELKYKVILIGTALGKRFNIHLVQGDIKDLNIGMKIELQPSKEVEECHIKGVKSSQNIVIHLPLWLATSETNYHSHLENLRSSFTKCISLALDQVKHFRRISVAFSTAHIEDTEHPFLADVIARGIVEQVFEKFESLPALQSEETGALDIYICDPSNEAVFNAFKLFLKLQNVHVGPPNQASWDKICIEESYNYPDYEQLKPKGVVVEISFSIPFVGHKACIFYPIDSSLEIMTCPAVKDPNSVDWTLKSSINELQKQNEDGLLPGQICPLKDSNFMKNGFVYCSPVWGMDCKKTVETILKECMEMSSGFEDVYIVPPGTHSNYPVIYLVQMFFRTLDKLINSQQYFSRKRIVLLVLDSVYRKEFCQELQKRGTKPNETGIIRKMVGSLVGTFNYFRNDKENTNREKVPTKITKNSTVLSTVFTFWSTSEKDIQQAVMKLEKHLRELMNENTKTVNLNKKQADIVQDLIKDTEDCPVHVSYTELHEIKHKDKNHKEKNKGKNSQQHNQRTVPTSFSVTLKGLSMTYVNEFLSLVGCPISTKQHEKDLKNESVSSKPQTSKKPSDAASSTRENSTQQRQDIILNHGNVSYGMQALASKQLTSYKWMWESDNKGSYSDIGTTGKEIERAYIGDSADSSSLTGTKFTHVNFTKMTVIVDLSVLVKQVEKGIIRTEYFETQPETVPYPLDWTSMSGSTYKNVQIQDPSPDMNEFKKLGVYLEQPFHTVEVSLVRQTRNIVAVLY